MNSKGNICLACGFCCNGVIFADVKFQRGDDSARLKTLGLAASGGRFPQPCTAWQDCRCVIYPDRPTHCHQFECLLLESVLAGRISDAKAREVIQQAKKQVKVVVRLMRALGEDDETADLRQRMVRTTRRMEAAHTNPREARLFGELTEAFHDLDQTLRERFYTG